MLALAGPISLVTKVPVRLVFSEGTPTVSRFRIVPLRVFVPQKVNPMTNCVIVEFSTAVPFWEEFLHCLGRAAAMFLSYFWEDPAACNRCTALSAAAW